MWFLVVSHKREPVETSIIFLPGSFVCRMESLEVAAEDVLCGKGYELVLFLFTDILVVTKKKASKIGGMMRSPSTASLAASQAPVQTKVPVHVGVDCGTVYITNGLPAFKVVCLSHRER